MLPLTVAESLREVQIRSCLLKEVEERLDECGSLRETLEARLSHFEQNLLQLFLGYGALGLLQLHGFNFYLLLTPSLSLFSAVSSLVFVSSLSGSLGQTAGNS